MTDIYLVRGESGEYDDWRRWSINAHPTLERAEAEAARLMALQADWREKYLAIDIDSTEDWFERREAVDEESRAVWCDASDDIKFDVEAIPFVQSAALVPQGWREMDSAPKDGTPVWLWWDGKRRLAHWHEAVNPPSIGGRFANWLTDDKGSVSAVTKPTLWHALPAPPLSHDPPQEPRS